MDEKGTRAQELSASGREKSTVSGKQKKRIAGPIKKSKRR